MYILLGGCFEYESRKSSGIQIIHTSAMTSYYICVSHFQKLFLVLKTLSGSTIWTCRLLFHLLVILKVISANSVDPDQTASLEVV